MDRSDTGIGVRKILYEIELFIAIHLWKVLGAIAFLVLIIGYALS